ncbi:SRPBCC family protein [Pelagibacterium limicola]|uniref:SRPBCC family protein n=1 Tax=Pelagibacterium limicola TaxID=2791022 RepID=UPI0018AF7163|nr:SRPBCC domain-containing protein [Pelagibacterium limicola]
MESNADLRQLQVTQDGTTDIIVRRSFAHPPARVWRAMTDPALIPMWMASKDAMTRCEIDLRPGGSFRYEFGSAFYFSGPILSVDAPHHMSFIEYFNGDTVSGTAVTTDLVAAGSGTRMTMVMRYASADARAAAIEVGMTDGFDEVYDKLEAVLSAT